MHENCPLWHCPLSDFYEVMKKNSIFVPSIYIHEKLIRFYSKSVPSKVMMKNSIIVPSKFRNLNINLNCLMFSFSIFSLQTFKWDSRNFIPKNVLEQNRQGKWWCILICILRSSSDLNSSVQRAQSCSRSRFFPQSFLSLLFVSLLETFESWQWNLQVKYYKWLNEI